MDDLEKTASPADIIAFASALMSNDNTRIKTQVELLIANTSQPGELMVLLLGIEPVWWKKIIAASEWQLSEPESELKSTVVVDLENRTPCISKEQTETGKAIITYYKNISKAMSESKSQKISENLGPKP